MFSVPGNVFRISSLKLSHLVCPFNLIRWFFILQNKDKCDLSNHAYGSRLERFFQADSTKSVAVLHIGSLNSEMPDTCSKQLACTAVNSESKRSTE